VADYAQVKRGVFAAVEAGVSQDLAAHSLGPIGEALTALLEAGKADGTVRPDVDARDVILLIGYLTRLEEGEWDARSRHLLLVILDGLRARPALASGEAQPPPRHRLRSMPPSTGTTSPVR
jgi:hypothetical protein